MDQAKIDKQKYLSTRYIHIERMVNYGYQVKNVMSFYPDNVLEIGVGNKMVYNVLKDNVDEVKTVDINESLQPNYLASVEDMPVADNSFDVVLAAEVLEHLPFEKFDKCLKEISRVAKKGAVISLPYAGYVFSFSFKVPLIKWKHFIFKLPKFWQSKTSTPEHYWELGLNGFSKSKIIGYLKKYFDFKKVFVGHDDPSHIFFVLNKK